MDNHAPLLRLSGIKKSFGKTNVLNGIDLEVNDGEFVTLLGPSGCGKTTTLRIIAGLESPDAGVVEIDGVNVLHLPPNKRPVNTVFQNYALFPHMTVAQNIAYGLKIKGMLKSDIKKTVQKMLELVRLSGYESRKPSQLSGGERQRVAIARAIALGTKLLLLDEPLGSLDLQLRRAMQVELKRLQQQLGVAFVYITHDQEEALSLSDKIAVMRNGQFDQIGTAKEVYEKPRTSYVARFVGEANILRGKANRFSDGIAYLACAGGEIPVYTDALTWGDMATIAVRAEQVQLQPAANNYIQHDYGVHGNVTGMIFSGGSVHITITLKDDTKIVATSLGLGTSLRVGQTVHVSWDPKHAILVEDSDK